MTTDTRHAAKATQDSLTSGNGDISGRRLTPEEAYSLVCDYVRADGWVQDGAGYWSHPDALDPGPGVMLPSALMISLRNDGIDPDSPAPPVAHSFGPRRDVAGAALCVVCGERSGVPIYGGKCPGCYEAQRVEREEGS